MELKVHGRCSLEGRSFGFDSGIGATTGAGVYVLVGTVAREHSGPSTISFLVARFAAALSAFCYAKVFASRCPFAGSAYH
ncbi:hypothetical protein HN51_019852 [Arachis hypogaea]